MGLSTVANRSGLVASFGDVDFLGFSQGIGWTPLDLDPLDDAGDKVSGVHSPPPPPTFRHRSMDPICICTLAVAIFFAYTWVFNT